MKNYIKVEQTEDVQSPYYQRSKNCFVMGHVFDYQNHQGCKLENYLIIKKKVSLFSKVKLL